MRKYLWGIVYTLILTIFTIYVLLDTFVITRIHTTLPSDDGGNNSAIVDTEDDSNKNEEQAQYITSPVLTATSYSDSNISISITEYWEYDTKIYVADVQLNSVDYLKTAFAQNAYGKNVTQKTSEIADANNAILAINGDYYGTQEKGYVLRNGILYRDTADDNQEDLVIYANGGFEIITEKNTSADALLNAGAQQILSFGPALITNNQISVDENDEVGKAKTSNPRTAIGIIDDLHYVFVVSDGRTNESEGLSLYELAIFMQSLGVSVGYNLDGGGSSTMVFNGKVINKPTSSGKSIKERSVSDIVYIGY